MDAKLNEALKALVQEYGFEPVMTELKCVRTNISTEKRIARLMLVDALNSEGQSVEVIAERAGVKPSTVKTIIDQVARMKRHPTWNGWDSFCEMRRERDNRFRRDANEYPMPMGSPEPVLAQGEVLDERNWFS